MASKWAESHFAYGSFLGLGMLYFALPYILRARRCVCLGSGGGFVPRLMVEAQRELENAGILKAVDVTLVDADCGPWGRPDYDDAGFANYPEIKLLKLLTADAALSLYGIDYLHVDADHSYEGALTDLETYGRLMRGKWAITIHDTRQLPNEPRIGTFRAATEWARNHDAEMVTFPFGAGTTVLMPKHRTFLP